MELRGGGPLLEGGQGFWMNSIKSFAFATFASLDHAQRAQQAIAGSTWPSETGKVLACSFSDTTASEAGGDMGDRGRGSVRTLLSSLYLSFASVTLHVIRPSR